MSLYTSPIGAFLSERTIGGRTRKVPMLAISGRVENDDTIKRSIVRSDCPLKGEISEI